MSPPSPSRHVRRRFSSSSARIWRMLEGSDWCQRDPGRLGCATTTCYVHSDDTTLGRVVVGNVEQKVATVRDQMQAYRTRMDEMSDRLSQSTIELASLEEKLLVMRIRLQDGIAELTLEPKQT